MRTQRRRVAPATKKKGLIREVRVNHALVSNLRVDSLEGEI